TLRRSDMHLVAAKRDIVAGFSLHGFKPLFAGELGVNRKKPKALCRPRLAFDADAIANGAPQHLISAAETKHCAAATPMRQDVDIEAGRAQRGEISKGSLRTGQNDQVGVAR